MLRRFWFWLTQRPFKNGDKVSLRFNEEDTFTPEKWEPGQIVSDPIEQHDGSMYVNVRLDDDMLVFAHNISLLRFR